MLPWLRQLSRCLSRSPKMTARPTGKNRARPRLEALEDRAVPAALQPIQCDLGTLQPMVVNDATLANIAERVCARLPTATFGLDAASDTGTVGDLRTSLAVVNLTGQAPPRARVELLGTGLSTQANAQGQFTFRDVPLELDRNEFTVRVRDRGGNVGQTTQIITLNGGPALGTPIADVNVSVDAPDTVIDLATVFTDPNSLRTLVRFSTVRGNIDVELFDDRTPQTVENFLNYVTSGRYRDTIFHRSARNFVIQGGGFVFDDASNTLPAVPTDPPVQNEPGISNVRGTIALAKLTGNPSSGTSQFFFNLSDGNAENLDSQNGGFTVFGEVVGSGLQVVDNIAAIPTQNRGGAFTEVPLVDFPSSRPFPSALERDNLALINDVTVRALGERLTFAVTSSNSDLVTASVSQNQLRLDYQPGQTGTATITIRATDREGAFVETTFTVTVAP